MPDAKPAHEQIQPLTDMSVPLAPGAGAVMFGAMPHLICARRCRLSYGVAHCRPHRPGDPLGSKFWHSEKCCYYTDDVFAQYVACNQLVEVDDVVEHVFYPCYRNQSVVAIELYGTDKQKGRFCGDAEMHKVANLVVDCKSGAATGVDDDPDQCPIRVQLHFGKAQLTMTAHSVRNGESKKTSIVFAHDCC